MESMACRVCKLALNVYTNVVTGEKEYIHSRPWVDQNHEPVPAALDLASVKMACDFCPTEQPPVTVYIGDEITFEVDGSNNTYSPGWTACQRCDQLIFAENIDALLGHVWEVTAARIAEAQGPAAERDRKAHAERLLREELAKVHLPMSALGRLSPADLAAAARGGRSSLKALRRGLDSSLAARALEAAARAAEKLANDRSPWEALVEAGAAAPSELEFAERHDPRPLWAKFLPTIHTRQNLSPVTRLMPARLPKARDALMRSWLAGSDRFSALAGPDLAARLASSLHEAELTWLSSEFTTLAGAAATNLDLDEHPLTVHDLPATDGMVVWADMVAPMPGRVPGYADVIAVSWTQHGDTVIVVPYAQVEQVIPTAEADLQELRRDAGWLVPVAPPVIVAFGAPLEADEWTTDLVRIVASTWFLTAQPGVAEVQPVVLDKALYKAYARARRPSPSVRLVDLRRRKRAAAVPGRTYSLTVRFMVDGHWRNQAYGPGRALRRRRYIWDYLKGPAGAPLKLKTPVVRVLR